MLPQTGLVLCEPFVLKTGATVQNWDKWRQRLNEYSQVVRQLAQEFETLFVPCKKRLIMRQNEQAPSIGYGMAFIPRQPDIN